MAVPAVNTGSLRGRYSVSDLDLRLAELEELCSVLGFSYKERLRETGIKPGQEGNNEGYAEVVKAIASLKRTKNRLFKELQEHCKKLVELWKTSTGGLSKNVSLTQLYAVVDATSADEIKTDKILSSHWINQVTAEKEKFEKAEKAKLKAKYMQKSKKLMDLMKLSHLSPIDVNFDPKAPVDPGEYKTVTKHLKAKIKELKPIFIRRKDLILRIELVGTAIDEGQSAASIASLVQKARSAATAFIAESAKDEQVRFDGQDVFSHLSSLWSMAVSMTEDFAADLEKQNMIALSRPRTRSRVRPQNAEQAGLSSTTRNPNYVCSSLNNATRNDREDPSRTKDNRRMLHLVFNVMDLTRAIKCYTECFGMSLVRKRQRKSFSYALLGYGPREKNISFLLIEHEGVDNEFSTGEGFGHVSIATDDVAKLIESVKASTFCKVARNPCRLSGGSMTIAFVVDPSGLLFELVQGSPGSEPIHRIMLYVSDLDQSINFYEKAVGMRVLRRKNEGTYKIAFLGFEDEEKGTVELRCSDSLRNYDHGDAFIQITIGTLDVCKSCEALKELLEVTGGEIVEEPKDNIRRCCFKDPDGWNLMFLDYADEELL